MSSLKSTEKPTTSSAMQKSIQKDHGCPLRDTESLEAIDNRLKNLLTRLTTMENSLAELSVPLQAYFDEDHGDTDQDLKDLQDALNDQDTELSDLADDEETGEKDDVCNVEELNEENSENP
ncbi:uncharacterized protein [Drosophila takahashii]|uniref:uncharacterized protein n=1 Tax=Drosophila takahashii TaxID=29030 RepID=UPI001CF80565|nr:uncharacterized protein LOC108055567 [Drosophila takahashii]